jgi:hypothetical protein
MPTAAGFNARFISALNLPLFVREVIIWTLASVSGQPVTRAAPSTRRKLL